MKGPRRKAVNPTLVKGRMPTVRRAKRHATTKADTRLNSFAVRYPHLAEWVKGGWIEMGWDDCNRSFVRALDIGGMVWEGDSQYVTLDEAFEALDTGIAAWLKENR